MNSPTSANSSVAPSAFTELLAGEFYSVDEMREMAACRERHALADANSDLPCPPLIKKALAYVTRRRHNRAELLVFRHVDNPQAPIQVPGGSIEPNELAVDGAKRELLEEAGLRLTPLNRIAVTEWRNPETGRWHRRHFYHFEAPPDVLDSWIHFVSGNGEDQAYRFGYFWVDLDEAARVLVAAQGEVLHLLR